MFRLVVLRIKSKARCEITLLIAMHLEDRCVWEEGQRWAPASPPICFTVVAQHLSSYILADDKSIWLKRRRKLFPLSLSTENPLLF